MWGFYLHPLTIPGFSGRALRKKKWLNICQGCGLSIIPDPHLLWVDSSDDVSLCPPFTVKVLILLDSTTFFCVPNKNIALKTVCFLEVLIYVLLLPSPTLWGHLLFLFLFCLQNPCTHSFLLVFALCSILPRLFFFISCRRRSLLSSFFLIWFFKQNLQFYIKPTDT